MIQIAEIKARTSRAAEIRNWLLEQQADFKGIDVQTDTYFNVTTGRLKLREGAIENSLIYYERSNTATAKQSKVQLFRVAENRKELKELLTAAHGIKVTVVKKREIYFIDNVKFHIDEVDGLGSFVEIEAIDEDGTKGYEFVLQQCNSYQQNLGIRASDLLTHSYSDLLLGLS
jgi:predicted adenylyl cyclase CyaB